MNKEEFGYRIQELIDENPFAIRAALKVLRVVFTKNVPTLAVTREKHPQLLVNLDFVNQHCTTDEQVKALICHEYLHILLRHTEDASDLTPAAHLAMDAVINSIIYRQMGDEYSSMMSNYYKNAKGIMKLLRPMEDMDYEDFPEEDDPDCLFFEVWDNLYTGTLVVDDIREVAETLMNTREIKKELEINVLLGNHAEMGEPLPEALSQALDHALRTMNGDDIWRSPKARGFGSEGCETGISENEINLNNWKRSTLAVLRKYIIPNHKGIPQNSGMSEYVLPVLSSSDRRAFIRTLWSPFIPDASWKTERRERLGQSQIYLDVSGSMHAEMPYLVHLLNKLKPYILAPFWAFSTEVAPAIIRGGQLVTNTTGGTSLSCVLEHIAATRPSCAVILTDGYIEPVSPDDVRKTLPTRIAAIVSRDGNPRLLEQACIPYTQLERIPQ